MQPSKRFHAYCPGCGYMTDTNTRFCIKCGTAMLGTPQASFSPLLPPTNKPSPQLSPVSAFCLDGGRYVDIKPLSNRGGMGLIFHGHDIRGGYRECIIKQLRPDPDLDQALFEREAALLATLHHDHIPACWDHFTENGAHYLVSEFIQGVALQDLIEQSGPASEHEVIRWGIDLCDALIYTHGKHPPIIHRDIKPDNVIITPTGAAALVDFGIARTYTPGQQDTTKMGTWGYLPPEQKAGRTVPTSDLYALGATLYFALTAHDPQLLPILDINLQWQQGISFPPAHQGNPHVSAEMEAILAQATCVLVKDRYPSARALLDALRTLQTAQASGPCPYCQTVNPLSAPHCQRCGNRLFSSPIAPSSSPAHHPAQNWDCFRGTAARAGVTADGLPPPLKPVWSFQTQAPVDGSPIIHQGIIYVGSRDQWLYACDANDQRELWRYRADAPLRSTPTLHGQTLFFGDDGGTMYAVQSLDGTARWHVPLDGKIVASAALGAGLLITTTQAGTIRALNPSSGETIWEHADDHPFYASPAIFRTLVLVANSVGQLTGLDLISGQRLWTFQASGPVRATPACHAGRALCVTLDGTAALLDLPTGAPLWQRSLGAPFSASPVLSQDRIFVAGQDGAIFALSRQLGTLLWTSTSPAPIAASPILCGPTLLLIDTVGTLLLLDAATGSPRFQLALGAPVFASPAVSGPWCVVATRQGTVYVLDSQPSNP